LFSSKYKYLLGILLSIAVTVAYSTVTSYMTVQNVQEDVNKSFSGISIEYDTEADYKVKENVLNRDNYKKSNGQIKRIVMEYNKGEYILDLQGFQYEQKNLLGSTHFTVDYDELNKNGEITSSDIQEYIKNNKMNLVFEMFLDSSILIDVLIMTAYLNLIAFPLRSLFIYITTKASIMWRYKGETPLGTREAMAHNLKEDIGGFLLSILIGLFAGAIVLEIPNVLKDVGYMVNTTAIFVIYMFIITSIYAIIEHVIVSRLNI